MVAQGDEREHDAEPAALVEGGGGKRWTSPWPKPGQWPPGPARQGEREHEYSFL